MEKLERKKRGEKTARLQLERCPMFR